MLLLVLSTSLTSAIAISPTLERSEKEDSSEKIIPGADASKTYDSEEVFPGEDDENYIWFLIPHKPEIFFFN